ncbi:MAG: hypothetical protein H0X25_03705 [Acidobacteriales bacterium]|nr:hypothetical protein [Terriglobales bacterium]
MSKHDPSKYSIGYKKPPRHTQFKSGQSGNPKGRPRKAETMPEIVDQELRAPVWMVDDGRRKKISSLRAIVKYHVHKALKGDARAGNKVLELARTHQPATGDNLPALVQEMRATHARHLAADAEPTSKAEAPDPSKEPEQ